MLSLPGDHGNLVDVRLSESRDRAAAEALSASAQVVIGITPQQVTTDGHDAYPGAIRTKLGKRVIYRTSRYLNNPLEQDHRGIKGRYRPMRGFKSVAAAQRFCLASMKCAPFCHILHRAAGGSRSATDAGSIFAGPIGSWASGSKPPDQTPFREPKCS